MLNFLLGGAKIFLEEALELLKLALMLSVIVGIIWGVTVVLNTIATAYSINVAAYVIVVFTIVSLYVMSCFSALDKKAENDARTEKNTQ